MKKPIALLLALVLVFALAACGSGSADSGTQANTNESTGGEAPATSGNTATGDSGNTATVSNDQAAAPGDDAGFEEIEIFADEEISFINVNAVYFQPVPMAPGQENYEDFDLHLECDVSAMDNTLGYGVGDWIPYLTIDYKVIGSDGNTAAEGTMMHMAASDGPHYGANIKLPDADTYSLEFTIHSPAEMGYMVHSDAETGPGGLLDAPEYWGNGNLVLRVDDCWDYVPQEW